MRIPFPLLRPFMWFDHWDPRDKKGISGLSQVRKTLAGSSFEIRRMAKTAPPRKTSSEKVDKIRKMILVFLLALAPNSFQLQELAHIINHLPCQGRDLPSTSSGTFRFYRVFFYYFEKFLRECKNRFEKKYGYFRPVIQDVVEKYPDCGNPMCGFARMRCPDCWEERLLMFSCKTRGFCPSYHAKLREEWEEWMREELLLNVPHRQVVFAVPKMLFLFFCFKRKLLTSLCLSAVRALVKFLHTAKGVELMPVHQLPSSYPCLDDQRNHSLGQRFSPSLSHP